MSRAERDLEELIAKYGIPPELLRPSRALETCLNAVPRCHHLGPKGERCRMDMGHVGIHSDGAFGWGDRSYNWLRNDCEDLKSPSILERIALFLRLKR